MTVVQRRAEKGNAAFPTAALPGDRLAAVDSVRARALGLAMLGLGSWLLYQSRWVVVNSFTGERDSNPLVYVIYGAVTWLPGLLLGVLGCRLLLRNRKDS